MRASRISIAGAMLAVIAIALGLAAMARPSEMASKAAFTAALASMGVAILGVTLARGQRRVGWGGYFFFTGGYLSLSLGTWLGDRVGSQLVTSALLDSAYDRMSYTPTWSGEPIWARTRGGDRRVRFEPDPSFKPDPGSQSGDFLIVFDDGARVLYAADGLRSFGPEVMSRLGHSLCAILLGLIGAVVARMLSGRDRGPSAPTSIGVDRPIAPGL